MISPETPRGRVSLLGSIFLMLLGGLAVLVTVVALIGLVIEGRFTGASANASLIVLLVGTIILGGGIMLYRRIQRDESR